jgi:hypothetical protein
MNIDAPISNKKRIALCIAGGVNSLFEIRRRHRQGLCLGRHRDNPFCDITFGRVRGNFCVTSVAARDAETRERP